MAATYRAFPAVLLMVVAAPGPALAAGDATRGAELYAAKCSSCHAPDVNKLGPSHQGVVGRAAGAVPGYAYSPKLKASGIVWTPANLDTWLAGPQKMVPGNKMFLVVSDAQQRADLIAYLATLK